MSVVITIRNPGHLVDQAAGIGGIGDVAGKIGLGGVLGDVVDAKLAGLVKDELTKQGAVADVVTTSRPPPSADESFLRLAGAFLVGGALVWFFVGKKS